MPGRFVPKMKGAAPAAGGPPIGRGAPSGGTGARLDAIDAALADAGNNDPGSSFQDGQGDEEQEGEPTVISCPNCGCQIDPKTGEEIPGQDDQGAPPADDGGQSQGGE